MRSRQSSDRESIWEYPPTPDLRPTHRRIQVVHRQIRIADTTRACRVCEQGHPPSYYIPPEDVRMEFLVHNDRKTFSAWKGVVTYLDLVLEDDYVERAAWYYPEPNRDFEEIREFVGFFPHRVEACLVDGERANPGPDPDFGGWLTSHVDTGEPRRDRRHRA